MAPVAPNAPRCNKTTRAGTPCQLPAISGGTVCRLHGGGAPQVRTRAAVAVEASRWKPGSTVDPIITLMQLIAGTSALYDDVTADLEAAYTAAAGGEEWAGYSPRVRALVGATYASDGNGGRVETGEAIRGLALYQGQLADRLARFCKLAADAGVSERLVRIEEKRAAMVAEILRGALTDAGLDDRATEVLAHAGRRLRLVAG